MIFAFVLGLAAIINLGLGSPNDAIMSSPVVVEPRPGIIWASSLVAASLPPLKDAPPVEIYEPFEAEKLRILRSGIVGDQYRWGANIDFQISTAFTSTEYFTIHENLEILAGIFSVCRTVRLYQQTGTPLGDYLFIEKGSVCSSYVGRQGGRQVMNLSAACVNRGSLWPVSIMIFAVGFRHENNRPDRDEFVNVFWENIVEGSEHNFQTNPRYNLTFGVPYDYYSIVHSGERSFSLNGAKTIEALTPGVVVGSRGVVTDYDRMKIRAMYNCDLN